MKNNRTFLEKLLDGAEVEWKLLGEVAKIQRGASPRPISQYITDDPNGIPWIKIGDTTADSKYIERTAQKITPEGAEKSRVLKCGDFVMSNSMSYGRPYILKISGAIHDGWASISDFESILTPNFLYYYLSSNPVQDYWDGKINSSSVSNLNSDIIKSLPIPIPPLSVQTEIVKILDALTALTSKLTSELILRRKQYEYYREKLLSEEELGKVGFEWKTLEELVEKTQNIRWKNNTKTYRYIDLTSVDRENNSITGTIEINALNAPSRAQKIVKENDIIFATTRPTQQRIASITKEFSGEIASTGYCVLRANTDIVLPKWLFYFLSTINFKNYVEENQSGSAYPAISDSKVKEFRIPVPDVTIQQSIIEKLDKFYGLTNSLLHGLPKEINNRTKQYLYYQKELLNFKGEDL
jgi:restriction modification system DNA specificity domain protein